MARFIDRILSYGPMRILTEDEAARSVVVSNIPQQTTAEDIVIYFQKRKNGGGDINHLHITEKGSAVIIYDSIEGESLLLPVRDLLFGELYRRIHQSLHDKFRFKDIFLTKLTSGFVVVKLKVKDGRRS